MLADLPEEQRAVAERALQGGVPAVRQAIVEQNARLKTEGKEEIPAAGLVSMAEQLLPKLRVAEWLDRADAAKADIEELDLRDLRSVVAAGDDPMVARDESTRAIAEELKVALAAKQEKELTLWFGDIDAALGVGRIIRALKLSSQPPKAGVRFPTDLAKRLADAATASLTPDALTDRWAAVLEAAAFSPVRAQVTPVAPPPTVTDELRATVTRLGPLLPQIAALFGVEVKQGGSSPKPLRPSKPAAKTAKAAPKAAPRAATIPPPPAPSTDSADAPVAQPDEPAHPDEPAQPVEPAPPVESAQPVEPAQPMEAVELAAAPATEPVPVPAAAEPFEVEAPAAQLADDKPATELAAEPDAVVAEDLDPRTATEVVESIESEAAVIVDDAVAPAEDLPTVEAAPDAVAPDDAMPIEAGTVEAAPVEADPETIADTTADDPEV